MSRSSTPVPARVVAATGAAPEPPEDDAALVQRVLRGDIQRFAELVRRYNQRLYRLARGILGDDQEALDAVQESYVRAFSNLGSLAKPEEFSAWLHVITRNEAYSMLRRRIREAPTETETMARIVDEAGGDRRQRPDSQVDNARLGRLLEQAVDRLPEPFRVVFVLRAVEGLSVRETSQILDVNEKTVKTRLFRARRLLRSELERRFLETGVGLYEFAGGRCDRLTSAVMARVARQANQGP